MPIEIKVGPPIITISQGRTFMVTEPSGEIAADTTEGVFAIDTRFISFYALYINRVPLVPINSSPLSFYAARYHLTNPVLNTEAGVLSASTLGITLDRIVSKGIHEEFQIRNYTGRKVQFLLELALRSDFADLFEVKSQRLVQRGRSHTEWHNHRGYLRTSYDNEDYHRAVTYQISNHGGTPIGYANGRIFFEIELEPAQVWRACGDIILEHAGHTRQPDPGVCRLSPQQVAAGTTPGQVPLTAFDARQARWQERCTGVITSNDYVDRMYRQAIEDMGALRIYDLDVSDEAWVPAAGVPWFVTLFGRDSLITALQNMSVSPGFARGALKRLAEYQATVRDDWRDAQPGKILHELRFGELSHFHKVPFTPYYGTADATILYLLVLSEAYRWTNDVELLKEYQDVALKCLDWIDQYGDLDGDGFQEYKTFSSLGYENIGWKDAGDAVVYADGTQVKQPKALCELQGYVYDAKLRMAEVFQALGDEARAQALLQQAQTLKQKFNEAFWVEDEHCYAYGLDPAKKQITAVASNVGQCLWSGIAEHDRAKQTAERLLQEDMWSGWGIRTLSRSNPAYNPYAYQLGSVWPHDNGMIAAGFKRYGLADEANFVIRGVFDAIERFDAYRPPELFAGIQRDGVTDFPVLYPGGANIPQAWATGSIFQMLQTILGLRADAPHKRLYVHPTLPDWLPDIKLERLRVGKSMISLRFWREGGNSRWEVTEIKADAPEDEVQVVDEADNP